MSKRTIREQFRRNSVALISLAIAITSLAYNTWRNEASEHNRNQRLVSIELLLMLGELQRMTLDCHYGQDDVNKAGILRAAWTEVLTIRDIARVASGEVPAAADNLYEVWSIDYKHLDKTGFEGAELRRSIAAKDRVIDALEQVRLATHAVLQSLD